MSIRTLCAAAALLALPLLTSLPCRAQSPVRGIIPRAKGAIVIDGKLGDWAGTFSTPANFGHADWTDRAGVWHYLWDDRRLYIGLECLDTAIFNRDRGLNALYDGDGLEFYLDVREGAMLGGAQYAPGTMHLHLAAATDGELKPRVNIRGGLPGLQGLTADGIHAAAAKTAHGYTLEFVIPWSKFPGFQPAAGREIGIDVELCYSDGAQRVDRHWVYSSAAAVSSPSAFARVRLVESWDAADAGAYSEVLFPSFLARSSPLNEPATLFVGVSPAVQPLVKKVEMTASGRRLPMLSFKSFGPGWKRAQGCLVGFLTPNDTAVEMRFLGEGDRVLGARTVPVR